VATPFSWARLRMRIGVLGEGVGRGDENETGAFSSAEVKAAEETRASPAAATRVRRLRAGDGGGAGGGEASPLRLKRGDWRVPVPDRARDVPARFTRFNCSARPASAAAAPPTLLCGELKKASSGPRVLRARRRLGGPLARGKTRLGGLARGVVLERRARAGGRRRRRARLGEEDLGRRHARRRERRAPRALTHGRRFLRVRVGSTARHLEEHRVAAVFVERPVRGLAERLAGAEGGGGGAGKRTESGPRSRARRARSYSRRGTRPAVRREGQTRTGST
jgi:hypothetical protein